MAYNKQGQKALMVNIQPRKPHECWGGAGGGRGEPRESGNLQAHFRHTLGTWRASEVDTAGGAQHHSAVTARYTQWQDPGKSKKRVSQVPKTETQRTWEANQSHIGNSSSGTQ